MPLFHIQDADRPAHVVAWDYNGAVQKWRNAVATENEIPIEDVDLPTGVSLVCDDVDLIVDSGWAA